jgi:Co/Zn/Cd efflux system component
MELSKRVNMKNLQKQETENHQTTRMGIYSLLVNLALVGIKLIFSFITGSLALLADAVHSLAVIISLLLFFTAYEIVHLAIRGTEVIIDYEWWALLIVAYDIGHMLIIQA